jgi:transposase
MKARSDASNLTVERWALVADLIPVYPGGRPRKTSMRRVLDATFYVLRTGCQWQFLPKHFPPKSTA